MSIEIGRVRLSLKAITLNSKANNILFLIPYPLRESPSQRFRFEQYFGILKSNHFNFKTQSFFSEQQWRIFYSKGRPLSKTFAITSGIFKRLLILFEIHKFGFVFIHREAAPIGPPVFEWLIAKIFRKKIIYDFDDAIWLTDRPSESLLFRVSKWRSKVKNIIKWSYRVSCGNDYLCDYARQFNQRVTLNPTTIDTEHVHNPEKFPKKDTDTRITIGWTGSHSTLRYLKEIEAVLQQLENEYPQLSFSVIADKAPDLQLKNLHFNKWSEQTEIKDLAQFDIGVMPLEDDAWAKGKCGFKALQYMAMRVPAIASPVGVNTKIIKNDVNGFLCASPDEWKNALRQLINDPAMRKKMGASGRQTVLDHYSVDSNAKNFLSLFAF